MITYVVYVPWFSHIVVVVVAAAAAAAAAALRRLSRCSTISTTVFLQNLLSLLIHNSAHSHSLSHHPSTL